MIVSIVEKLYIQYLITVGYVSVDSTAIGNQQNVLPILLAIANTFIIIGFDGTSEMKIATVRQYHL